MFMCLTIQELNYDKSLKCVLLGVSEESKAYSLYDPVSERIIISGGAVFKYKIRD